MQIQEIYKQYKIMPSLQRHMYRVAAVAKIISNNITLNSEYILSACLLHDMGNILKFDLNMYPDFLQPEGLDYWSVVKKDYHEKYGDNEHLATVEIAKELGVSTRTEDLIDSILFENAEKNYESGDIEKMICQYADMRVAPYGVRSLEARLADGRRRFKLLNSSRDDEDLYRRMVGALQKIEESVFSKKTIKPEYITDELVRVELEKLPNFSVK